MYLHVGDGVFAVVGLMQGGEYILSRAASSKHGALLEEINLEKGIPGELLTAHSHASSVINTNFLPPYGGIWIHSGQFVVNRYSTSRHIAALERLNAESMANRVHPAG